MGLYLCVFEDDTDIDGIEVGNYSDFARFRDSVTALLENGFTGDKYPTLILHSDCDGEWSPELCENLRAELHAIEAAFRQLPPAPFESAWQKQVADLLGLRPASLFDSMIDVDGEPLIERLIQLTDLAIERKLPILFQ